MRSCRWALLCAVLSAAAPARAWHAPVHKAITISAWQSLPADFRAAWGDAAAKIPDHSMAPDLYVIATGALQEEMRPFCEVEGRAIHNVTWNRREDMESLDYLRRSIAAALAAHEPARAARFAGTLAHFIQDSLSPAHALTPWDSELDTLREVIEPTAGSDKIRLHTFIEASAPPVNLAGRTPRRIGNRELLEAIYAGVRANRDVLLDVGRAAFAGDQAGLNAARHASAVTAAQLLADALYSAVEAR
jgi:hypothetical protein